MSELEKTIIENGIMYTLGADELYYPDLEIPEGTHYDMGRFGRMRGEVLKEYRHSEYMKLLLSGKLNQYLHEFEEECNEMMEQIVEQMKLKEGVTEELKAKDQINWVGRMNNIRVRAEEIVVRDIIVLGRKKNRESEKNVFK